jgi:flagellar basal body rod protein FlgG
MEKGLYVALSGAVAQQRAMDEVAHNVANASTPGFRAGRVSFAEHLQRETDNSAPQTRVATITPDSSQGPIKNTNRALDVAISGDGFFTVQTGQGVRYTRAGNFHLDEGGRLLTSEGFSVLDKQGAEVTMPNEADIPHVLPELGIAKIAPENLLSEGQYLRAAGTVEQVEHPDLISGALEGSNLNVVRGMTDLIRVSRTYEALTRMIEGYKEIDQRTAREVGSAT